MAIDYDRIVSYLFSLFVATSKFFAIKYEPINNNFPLFCNNLYVYIDSFFLPFLYCLSFKNGKIFRKCRYFFRKKTNEILNLDDRSIGIISARMRKFARRQKMYDWIYEELDPNLHWKVYYTKKKVLESIHKGTIMPENGLSAESLLNEKQLKKIEEIRKRKLDKVFEQFQALSNF